MDKAPLLCRIKSNIIRKSPSAIMAGCNFGIFPSGKCIDCPEYNAWWEEFEWSILKMVELKPAVADHTKTYSNIIKSELENG